MRFRRLVIFILCGFSLVLKAQDAQFKKVSDLELLKEQSAINPESTAEYLHRSCKVEFEYIERDSRFEMIYTYFFRIKIYDDQDLSIANRSIQYFIGGKSKNKEEVTNIEAYTFNMVEGKITKEKLNSKNIYEEEVNRNWAVKKMALPAVRKGSVLDIKYKIRSIYTRNINKFYFQQKHPVVFAQYETRIPEYFTYSSNASGFYPLQTSEDSKKERLRIKQRAKIVNEGLSGGFVSPKQRSQDIEVDYITNIRTFVAADIPALEEEPYVNNMNNYQLGLGFELLSTQYPGSNVEFYSKNWKEIGKSYNSYGNFGKQLKKDYDFKEFLDNISDLSAKERMNSVFNMVRDDFNWNSYSTDLTKEGINNLIKTGTGNSAEINLLLTNLLRSAGLNANPILMRNRDSGRLNVSYPTVSDLNYVIVQVQLDNDDIYLDATDKHLLAGQLPRRAINGEGILINEEGGTQLNISNRNMENCSNVIELEIVDGGLKGGYQAKYKKYSAYQLHSAYNSDLNYVGSLNRKEGIKMDSTDIAGMENNTGDVSVSGKIDYSTYIQNFDEKYFIDYALDVLPKSSPFVKKERQFSIFFDSKQSNTSIVKYKIPEGYTIEILPENLNISLPNKMMSCIVQFRKTEKEIVVTIRNIRKVNVISPEYYGSLMEYYNQIIAKGNEKIVFTKL